MKCGKHSASIYCHLHSYYVSSKTLNDLDGNSADVLDIMQNRACVAHLCNPDWLIDTDNDLMVSKAAWRQYLQMQPQLGIPDTYYLWSIAASNEPLGPEDMDLLRHTWEAYRRTIAAR